LIAVIIFLLHVNIFSWNTNKLRDDVNSFYGKIAYSTPTAEQSQSCSLEMKLLYDVRTFRTLNYLNG